MNILQILPELNVGGVERGVVDLSRYLKKQGHKVVVVSNGGRLVADLEKEGITHYSLAVHKKSFFSILRMIKEVSRIIRKEDIEIIHARSRVPAWIGLIASWLTETKFITTCHGYYSRHFFSRVMGWSKLVIVPSLVIKRHMMDDFSVPQHKIRKISRSVDLEIFKFSKPRPDTNKIIVGMISRVVPLKGHIDFLKAMAKVVRVFPFIKIWIVGEVPPNKQDYKQELDTLIRRLVLSDYVEFLGHREDVASVLSNMNVLVFASTKEESFGRSIIEAQAVGVPVVATKIQSATEIIADGVSGLLVQPQDHNAMAEAITRLLKDKKLVSSLVSNARKNIEEKYTLQIMADKTIGVYKEALDFQNILIIKIAALGDVILATPSLRAIREHFPKAIISCLVGKQVKEILENCPYVDELIVYDYKGQDKAIKGIIEVSQRLRRFSPDIVVDLQNNRRSHMLAFLSFAQRRYGYKNGKFSFLLNHLVEEPDLSIGPVQHQARTLAMLDVKINSLDLEMWPGKEDGIYVKRLLDQGFIRDEDILVGINIGASRKWQTKRWPLENFAQVCDELASDKIKVIITGDSNDLEDAKRLLNLTKTKPRIFCAKTTINQLYCLIKRCRVFVSADTASLHVASAAARPFVALFGPTEPSRHVPPSRVAFRVIKKYIECSPCYRRNCKTSRCMKLISPAEVVEAVKALL